VANVESVNRIILLDVFSGASQDLSRLCWREYLQIRRVSVLWESRVRVLSSVSCVPIRGFLALTSTRDDPLFNIRPSIRKDKSMRGLWSGLAAL
jgi:hypothetical protein